MNETRKEQIVPDKTKRDRLELDQMKYPAKLPTDQPTTESSVWCSYFTLPRLKKAQVSETC